MNLKIPTYVMSLTLLGIGIFMMHQYQRDKNYIDRLSHNNCHVTGAEIHTHLDTRYRRYVLTANVSYFDDKQYQTRIHITQSKNLAKMELSKDIYQDTKSECYTYKDKVYLKKPSPDSVLLSMGVLIFLISALILLLCFKLEYLEYKQRIYTDIQ